MDEKNITIKISTSTIIKAVLVVLSVIVLYAIRDILAVVLLSVVIASSVEPAAIWFQKRKIPRTVAVIFIYLSTFAVLGILFYFIIPTVFGEFSSFSGTIINYFQKPEQASLLKGLFVGLPASVSQLLQTFSVSVSNYISSFTGGFFSTASRIFGGAISFILVIVLSFYLSVQEKGIEKFLRIIFPLRYEEYVFDLWIRVRRKLGFWMQGQILLATIIGVLTYLGLTILGIEYALTFALLAGFFEIIPIFGPILASIPPIMVGFSQSPFLALKVAILYIIVQQFENHLIYPLVVRKIVGIPPVMSILALIIGWELGGFMGLLLSVPLVTALVEILDDMDKRRRTK